MYKGEDSRGRVKGEGRMIGRKKKNHRTIIIVIIATIAILVTRKAGDRGRDSEDSLVPKEKKFLAFFCTASRQKQLSKRTFSP